MSDDQRIVVLTKRQRDWTSGDLDALLAENEDETCAEITAAYDAAPSIVELRALIESALFRRVGVEFEQIPRNQIADAILAIFLPPAPGERKGEA